MPRFALGDQVVTPEHGEGEVVMVHANKVNNRCFYSVSVATERQAVMCHEPQLRAVPFVPQGSVRCADCCHLRKSHFMPGSGHCTVLGRGKAIHSQRQCNTFKRRITP